MRTISNSSDNSSNGSSSIYINLGGEGCSVLEEIIQPVALEDTKITLDDIITGNNMSEESGRRLDRLKSNGN